MSEPDPIPENPAIARAEIRLRRLERLSELGMEIAERVAAPDEIEDADALAKRVANFATVSRFVRLTISLETKTDLYLSDLKAGVERNQMAEAFNRDRARAADPWREMTAHRQKISGLVHDIARTEAESESELCELNEALEERLEHDLPYIGCDDQPVREIVERLCRDIGLNPDMSLWDGEGWVGLPDRESWSPFNKPSRKRLLDDEGWPLEATVQSSPHDLE
jgi:hypothetical protein